MNFAEAAMKNAAFTRTENGAVALNTTGDARLDFFGTAGSLRGADKERITRLFSEAYKEDPLFATKIAFYARDIRGGLGERQTFRMLLQFMAKCHPEALRPNLDLIGVYGRYDDLYCLIGTPLENEMWAAMKRQFEEDRQNLQAAFRHVLEIAVQNHVAQEDMPKSLIVISDMEIDYCGDRNWTFYEKMSQKFRQYGYQIPNIIFWNAASRHDVFHADRSRAGVQLVSGHSAAVFRQVMQCVGLNPVEAMEKIINSERYASITVA